MRNVLCAASLMIVLSCVADAGAESLRVGAQMPELRLSDQHGVEATIGVDDKVVIFSRDMGAGNIVKAALAERGGATMAAAKAVYVADITAMPSVITSLFALPSMRKRDYRIFLDRDGEVTADIPSEQGKVTVLALDGRVISRIDSVDSAPALRALLGGK